MTESIAILALCVSLLMLIIQYTNQRERRHGDLVQLRSNLLTKLSAVQQRTTSFRMHAETARIDLRTMKESNDKYDAIEAIPDLIEKLKHLENKYRLIIDETNAIDTMKANTSKTLLRLQSAQHLLKDLEDNTSEIETAMLNLMEQISTHQNQ